MASVAVQTQTAHSIQSESVYVILQKGNPEKARLNLQYPFFLKHLHGNRLIHDASIILPSQAVLLDSGTGTGSWLMDVAKILPTSSTLHGIDIYSTLFPDTSAHPNLHFHQQSITCLPPDWSSSFDFVSQTLLTPALTTDEWELALTEIYRILKPGGHVQFSDADWEQRYSSGGPGGRKLNSLMLALAARHSLMPDFSRKVPYLLQKIGFQGITVETRLLPVGRTLGADGIHGEMVMKNAVDVFKGAVLRLGGLEDARTERDFEALAASLEDDWANGHEGASGYYVICATKPSA